MTLFVGLTSSLKREHASQAAGFATVIIGFAALTGWWAGLPLLSSWGSGTATMKPLTAFCFAAVGLPLVYPAKDSRFAFTVGLTVATVALLDLGADVLNLDPGIGRLEELETAIPRQGEILFSVPHATALGLAFAAGSLALSRFERHGLAAAVLVILAGAIAATILLGYLTGIVTLYGPAPVSSPALPTAVGLLCLAGGIILRIGSTPTFRKPRPLRHLLFILGCAIVIPLLLFGIFAGSRIADAQFHQIRKDLMNEARSLSTDIDREIIGEFERLQALAASPSLRQGDFAAFQSQAEASLSIRQSGNIALIDSNMQQLANTWVPFGTPLPKEVVPKPVERALATGKPQVTGIFTGPVTEELTFGIIMPVKIDGESRYAIVRSPNPHVLAGLIAANELPAGWYAVVSDATHRIITRSEQRDAFVGKELPPTQWQGADAGGLFEFIDPAGRPSLQASVWSELTGWETSVWAPKALLEAPVRTLWWTIGSMALLALTLVVALALWLSRIIASSVSHTARAAIALGDGLPPPLSETPIAEVNTLIREFRRTAAKRSAAEARLAEREAQLALFVEHAPAAIAMFDTDMVCLAASRRFLSDFRLPENVKVIGISHYEAFPEIPPRWREVHRRVLAGEELSAHEDSFLRPDGRTEWSRWSMKPWRTSEGQIGGALLFVELITQQVEARRALADSEARFRATFENAAVGIAHVAPDGRLLRVNEALCRIFGYPADELVTKSFLDITHPDDLAADLAAVKGMLEGKINRYDVDKRHQRKDGSFVWARVTVGTVRKSDGSIDYFVSVVEDISARKHAEQALQASKDRLQFALDAARLGWWQHDLQSHVVRIDVRAREFLDVAEDKTDFQRFINRVHPDDIGRVSTAIEAALDPVDPKPCVIEFRVRSGVGERWLEAHGLAHFAGDGRARRAVSLVGTVQDITERKEREEKESLLMREINHRAKNMLSVVDAIAHQTAARNPQDFIERFSERIQALSANQDLLVRNEWKGVEIADLVRAQLAHFVDLIGSRIAKQGPRLRLNPASAQAIGLALHELTTNAAKYGALSTNRGRIDICWGGDPDTFTMSWTERDGPPVSPPQQRGFGIIVMEMMAERSVGGEVDLDYAPTGVTWRLTCPAANALEPENEPACGRSPRR